MKKALLMAFLIRISELLIYDKIEEAKREIKQLLELLKNE